MINVIIMILFNNVKTAIISSTTGIRNNMFYIFFKVKNEINK